MRKSSMIAGSLVLTALGGYGAWCVYKKMQPQCANKLKSDMMKATRNVEKSIEDMM